MGQGAAQAFEDMALLSRLLPTAGADYEPVFARYEKLRRRRVNTIRRATHNAEATRRATSSSLVWSIKSAGIRAALWAMGKGGYLGGSKLTDYDVAQEPL